jgi:iron(III) transport system substrate-binding protein
VPNLPESEYPQWLKDLKIIPMKVDWAVLADNEKDWMQHWDDNIKGKGK